RLPHRLPGRGEDRGHVRDRHQWHRQRQRLRSGDGAADPDHHQPLLRPDRGGHPRVDAEEQGHPDRPERLTVVDPTFAIETEALSGILDSLDYYQILKVAPGASQAEIKAAYHRESRLYHPDKVFQEQDLALKERVTRIYKRVTEAYFVLRDEKKRS